MLIPQYPLTVAKILQREDDGLAALQDYVIQNNVDCDLLAGFTFDVPTTQDLADQAEEQFHMYNDAGGSTERIIAIHNPGLAAELTGVKNARSCYIRPAATLQPWKLAAHIMRKNLDRGVALHTFKMVKTVVPSSDPRLKWTVRTDRGDVSCNTVIHATNAYAAAIEPMFRGVVRPYPQICIKAASIFPVTETTGLLGHSYTILLAEEKYVSVNSRTSSDGVVLLGGNIEGQARLERWVEDNPEHCVDDDIIEDQGTAADLRHFSKAHLSANSEGSCLADVDSDDNWSGIICSTPDRVPIIGEIPGKEGQWACVGFNGRGMVHAFPATSALIKLMVGGLWVDTGLPEAYSLTSQRLTG
jgi:glycine/D-amino acid oxidase-like deaminating enzyme